MASLMEHNDYDDNNGSSYPSLDNHEEDTNRDTQQDSNNMRALRHQSTDTTGYEVTVAEPEVRKGQLGTSYTAYSVMGSTPQKQTFATHRRFNDFRWLHEQLSKAYPGIFIPPLPPKKSVGRFEEDFISMRMELLHRFLTRVASSHLLSNTAAFQTFIQATEGALELAKKEFKDTRIVVADVLDKYRHYFDRAIDNSLPHSFTEKFEAFKDYIKQMDFSLKALRESCSSVADAHKSVADALGKFALGLKELTDTEVRVGTRLDMVRASPRYDATAIFETLLGVASEAPDGNFSILSAMINMEIMDIEAMKLALQTREEVQQIAYKAADKVNELQSTLDKVKRGGKGSTFGTLFNRKEPSLEEREADVAKARGDETAARELLEVINKILFFKEFDQFRTQTMEEYKQTLQEFARTQNNDAQKLTQLWGALETSL